MRRWVGRCERLRKNRVNVGDVWVKERKKERLNMDSLSRKSHRALSRCRLSKETPQKNGRPILHPPIDRPKLGRVPWPEFRAVVPSSRQGKTRCLVRLLLTRTMLKGVNRFLTGSQSLSLQITLTSNDVGDLQLLCLNWLYRVTCLKRNRVCLSCQWETFQENGHSLTQWSFPNYRSDPKR